MSTRPIKNYTAPILSIILMGGIISSGWFPRSCPILKKYTIGCRAPIVVVNPGNPHQQELNRIPHQVVPSLAAFSAKAQDDRSHTSVIFNYRAEDNLAPQTFLQLKVTDSFEDFSLASHPLLNELKWSVISNTNGPYLYQRTANYNSIEEFLAKLPNSSTFAADRVITPTLSLSNENYTKLEGLTSLDGIDYILTSRPPTEKDGEWFLFKRQFDFSNLAINAENKIEGQLSVETGEEFNPLLLSEIHIDYAKR